MKKSHVIAHLMTFIKITRPDNSLLAAVYTLLGAYLSCDITNLLSSTVLKAALVVGLVVAFGFVINDYMDVAVDSLSKPQRPIPSGQISPSAAGLLALVLTLVALGVAWTMGPLLTAIALATIILSTSYSFFLKNTLLLGNATIALLNATIMVYGSLATSKIMPAVWFASLLAFLYIFCQEILYATEDQEGDTLAGLKTTAVRLGRGAALHLFQVLALVFVIAAIFPFFLGLMPALYIYIIIPCSVLPVVGIIIWLSLNRTDEAIHQSLRVMRLVWFSSLLPLVLLK
ncbi:MAG: UbiA family prenyltransferase [Xenococcaceae cyanobacterium MO_234.B1]|nr:UbiA family prenyltransferase [Xenococcaceae cyanobacterium MO_234.B1]